MSKPPADALAERLGALPCWHGSITFERLHGGLSNESYLVTDGRGRHVARFGHDFPFHHVSREREVMMARAAHAAGFSPEVEYAEPGVMVSRFLGGRTLAASDVRAQADAIVDLLRDFHTRMPRFVSGPGAIFLVFHTIRDYARQLVQASHPMAGDCPRLVEIAETLEAVQVPLPIVIGHNDLLPANFLDDGKRLWLIDFEYAAFGTALFDLAGVSSNAGMDKAESMALLQRYFGAAPDLQLRRAFAAMQCASLLREALWGAVSEIHMADGGVDYAAYTADNLSLFTSAYDNYLLGYPSK